MNTETITYGGYCRKSSESEDKQIQSNERQYEELKDIEKREDLSVHGEYIMESMSAFSPGRPGFQELVQLTQAGKVNAWLCWHANRLSRNPVDAGTVIYLMDIGKLLHVKTKSRIYYNTPTDKFTLWLELIISKKDSDDKSGFVKSGLAKRYRRGLPCGIAPIGFLNDKSEEQGARGWLIDTDRYEKRVKIKRRFLKGMDSISSITDYSRNELCLTTVKRKRIGGKLINRSKVHQLLLSPIDAGYFYATNEHGVQQRYELDSSLPRAITKDEQQKIYRILNSKHTSRSEHHESKYGWLMKSETGGTIGADFKFQLICDCKYKFSYRNKEECPRCQQAISNLKSPTYLSYVYYYDIAKRKTKGVVAKTIEEKRVTEILTSYIEENFTISKDLHDWSMKYLKLLKDKEITANQSVVKAQQNFNYQLLKKKKKIREMYQEGMITKAEFQEDIDELEQQLKARPTKTKDWFKECTDTLDLSLSLQKTIENGSPQDRKEALSKFCSNLTWDGQNLSIINKPVVDMYIKGLNRIKAKIPTFEPRKAIEMKGLNDDFEEHCPSLRAWWDDVRTWLLKNMEKEEF